MRSLFVMDPLEKIQIDGDSTWMLMRESQRRGWPVAFCTPAQMGFEHDRPFANVQSVTCLDASPWFSVEPVERTPLEAFDVIWMRKDPPFDMDYVFCTYLLDLVADKTCVLNEPSSLKLANEKMFALFWPELGPETIVSNDIQHIRETVDRLGRAVIKPWDGNGGRGVLVTRKGDPNLGAMIELLTEEGSRSILVQEYLPEIEQGDKRIILVDGDPVGWFLRVPAAGDHRGNIHVGARVKACELTVRDREICAAIRPALKKGGMVFVGIDVIGDAMTEVNVTSPTGIQEANRLMGTQIERALIDVAERRAREFPRGPSWKD